MLRYEPGWRTKMVINGFGAVCTGVVTLVFAVTKFRDGAWVIIVLIPVLVFIFFRYPPPLQGAGEAACRWSEFGPPRRRRRHRVILPVSGVHQGTLAALRYAKLLSDDVTAVHISIDAAETEKVQEKWEQWGEGVRLVILDSPYRLMIEPLLAYIEEILKQRQPNEIITIVVPQFVPKHWWHNVLHTQTATWLRLALLFNPGIVITDVPYQVE